MSFAYRDPEPYDVERERQEIGADRLDAEVKELISELDGKALQEILDETDSFDRFFDLAANVISCDQHDEPGNVAILYAMFASKLREHISKYKG